MRMFAAVDGMIDDLAHQGFDLALKNFTGAISGAIVDDNDFHVRHRGRAHGLHDRTDRVLLVIAGDDDGELEGRRARSYFAPGVTKAESDGQR